MACPFSSRRAANKTAAITEPAVPPVILYARIATDGGQQSLDDQHAQTLTYLAPHNPTYLLLRDDSSEPARGRFFLPSMWPRAFQRHRHPA
jgi:hypothetical protein